MPNHRGRLDVDTGVLEEDVMREVGEEGTVTSTWRVLLDARVWAEETATSLRQNLMLTAIVVVLGVLILERVMFFGRPDRVLIFLLGPVMLVAGAVLDLLVYDRRVRRLEDAIVRIEAEHPQREHLEAARSRAEGRTFSRLGVAGYYAVPTVTILIIAAWRFF